MNPMFKKLLEKKKSKGETLSPVHGKAKSGILQGLIDDMMGADSDKVKGLKKVTVAASSPEGLEEGLEKAKDIVAEPESEDEELAESDEHEAEESEDEELAEHAIESVDTPEEIEDLIKLLEEKLKKIKLA